MPPYIWFPTLAGVALGYGFMSIPPVADQFMGIFGVGYAGLGLLLSGLLWSHALSQIPAGLLVDRIGVFHALAAGAGCAVLFNLLPFLAPNSLTLAIAMRFCLGLCTGVIFLSILKILGMLAPPEQMAKAQGFYGGSFGFGTMFPYFTLPYLGDWAWGWSYLITAGLFATTLAAVFFLPREGLRAVRPSPGTVESGPGVRELLARSFASPDIWMLGLMHGLFYGTLNNLGQWLPSILADLAGNPLKAWTLATTLVLFLGSCSRTLSGYFARLLSRKTAIYVCLFLTFALYGALGLTDGAKTALGMGLCLAVACGLCYGAIFTMGGRVLPAMFMGTALGLLNSLANLCNVGITLLLGYVREHTGSFAPALWMMGAVALLTLLVFHRRLARLDERLE